MFINREKIAQEALNSLGLSLGEAKTYLALATIEFSEATPLAGRADVPQSKIYSYLNSLENRFGIVIKQEIEGKPNRYRADPFSSAVAKLRERLDKNLTIAEEYIETQKELEVDKVAGEEYLRVVQGDRALKDRLEDLIVNSEHEDFLVLGVEPVIASIRPFFENSGKNLLTFSTLFESPPMIVQMLEMTEIRELLMEQKVLVLIEGVDLKEKTAVSFNIIGYPKDEMEIDPLLIHIRHPVIRNFQIRMFLSVVDIIKNMSPEKMLEALK